MGNNVAAVSIKKQRQYRQYMNRRGGFNRQEYLSSIVKFHFKNFYLLKHFFFLGLWIKFNKS